MGKEKKEKTIVQLHKENFEMLSKAFKNGEVALMECTEVATGEKVAVICTVTHYQDPEEYVFVPFAKFFNGNPYELLTLPIEHEDLVRTKKEGSK